MEAAYVAVLQFGKVTLQVTGIRAPEFRLRCAPVHAAWHQLHHLLCAFLHCSASGMSCLDLRLRSVL